MPATGSRLGRNQAARDVVDRILTARDAGAVRCSIDAGPSALEDVVRRAGLRLQLDGYRAIDIAAARSIGSHILHCDLARGASLLPEAAALALFDAFIAACGPGPLRLFTNGTFDRAPRSALSGITASCSWTPMTEATVDTGVIILGAERSAYLWVEDED